MVKAATARKGREGGRFDRALRLLEEGRREGGNADTEPGGKVALYSMDRPANHPEGSGGGGSLMDAIEAFLLDLLAEPSFISRDCLNAIARKKILSVQNVTIS